MAPAFANLERLFPAVADTFREAGEHYNGMPPVVTALRSTYKLLVKFVASATQVVGLDGERGFDLAVPGG